MKVVFPIDVYQKLRAYVECVRVEISGFGRISIKNEVIRIEEIKIFKQICSAGGTVIDRYDVGEFWNNLDDPSGWKLWWHSHGELQAYFSPTDHATMEERAEESDWGLSIVTNRHGDIEVRIDFASPFRYIIERIPWEIDYVPRILEDEVFEEVSRKVQIYQERQSKERQRKKNTNFWDGGEPQTALMAGTGDQPLLKSVLFGRDGKATIIDPEDVRKHPELFGYKGNAKKR